MTKKSKIKDSKNTRLFNRMQLYLPLLQSDLEFPKTFSTIVFSIVGGFILLYSPLLKLVLFSKNIFMLYHGIIALFASIVLCLLIHVINNFEVKFSLMQTKFIQIHRNYFLLFLMICLYLITVVLIVIGGKFLITFFVSNISP